MKALRTAFWRRVLTHVLEPKRRPSAETTHSSLVYDSSMKTCSFEGCGKRHIAKGWCVGHWRQNRRGEVLAPLAARTRVRLSKATLVDDVRRVCELRGECWIWKASTDKDGYAQARCDGTMGRVTRHLLGLKRNGSRVARHTCDTPSCCNPAHLLTGTVAQNNRDRSIRGRSGRSILTAPDASLIRYLIKCGARPFRLAKLYGVKKETIAALKRGRSWMHAPELVYP